MAQINVIGKNGGRTIDLELPEVNSGVLHDVVTWQLASRRRGTASTKTRAQVSATLTELSASSWPKQRW